MKPTCPPVVADPRFHRMALLALAVATASGCGGSKVEESTDADLSRADVPLDRDRVQELRWRSHDRTPPSLTIDTQSSLDASNLVTLGGQVADNQYLYR